MAPALLRILFVNHTRTVSGAERSLLDLLDGAPPSIEPTVATPAGPLADEVRRRGLPWVEIPETDLSLRLHPTRTAGSIWRGVRSALRVRATARAGAYDVVHANSLRAGLLTAPTTHAPRTISLRDCLPDGRLAQLAARAAARRRAHFLANSRYTADCFKRQAPAGTDIRVVHNPVDPLRFDPSSLSREEARSRLDLPSETFVTGIVGQLTPWKGHDTAVAAMLLLRERGIDASLLIVGEPRFRSPAARFDNEAYTQRLRAQITSTGLDDRVRLLGHRDDIPVVMRALDVLLVPSWGEPFGRVVVEALAMGTRVLATSVGGPAEIIRDEDAGALVPPRDAAAWASAIAAARERSRSGPGDPDRRREDVVRRFALDRHAASVAETWRRVARAA